MELCLLNLSWKKVVKQSVFKKKEIGRKPPPWKKVGHGGQAGATNSAVLPKPRKKPEKLVKQSVLKKRRRWCSPPTKGEKTPLAHGAVQLSDAKAFSLDWKVLIQRQEFCRYGTNFGAVEISIV